MRNSKRPGRTGQQDRTRQRIDFDFDRPSASQPTTVGHGKRTDQKEERTEKKKNTAHLLLHTQPIPVSFRFGRAGS